MDHTQSSAGEYRGGLGARNRPLTTANETAAACYRRGSERVCATGRPPIRELTEALEHDDTFRVAAVDLVALSGASDALVVTRGLSRWERQHIQIIEAARTGDVARAEALLCDHISEFGCDPIALLVVARRLGPDAPQLADIRAAQCRWPWARLT